MKTKLLLGLLVVLGVILALTACAKPPTEEIDAAKAALARAESDPDASQYAPQSITRAKNLVDRMQAAVDAKQYDSAKSLAVEAKAAAEKAIADGAAAKQKAKDDASAAIADAKTLLNSVQQALSAAGKVRGIALDIPTTQKDVSAAGQAITGAEADFTSQAYQSAQTKAGNARSNLAGIQRRIADAVQAATRRK